MCDASPAMQLFFTIYVLFRGGILCIVSSNPSPMPGLQSCIRSLPWGPCQCATTGPVRECFPPFCVRLHAIQDLQHSDRPSWCLSCKTCERCSTCHTIKKRKHFHNTNHIHHPFKTCDTCRSSRRVHIQREAARATGFRWCTIGAHQVRQLARRSCSSGCNRPEH
jgi:hypothetical protein